MVAALVACMAAPGAMLAQRYPRFVWVWLAMMLAALVYAAVLLAKAKREGR
jgi:TctA family transporter